MTTILIACIIFLDILYYFVIFDVILSWLLLAGINFRPQFIRNILDPLYKLVRTYIPTRIGVFELTPIIVIFIILFLKWAIYWAFPDVAAQINQIISQ